MKSFRFSRKVAFRYLWSKRGEAFITIITVVSILGVAIGVMVLNMVMAVMTGFEYELREKIVGTNSHITVRSLSDRLLEWRDVVEKVKAIDGVVSISPYTQHQALIRYENRSAGLIIRGVEKGTPAAEQLAKHVEGTSIEELFQPPLLSVERGEGEVSEESEVSLPALLVGRELAQSLGLFPGTPVSLLSPQVSSTPFGLMPRFKRFIVIGSYRSGLIEYESGLAYLSLEEAQHFFRMGDAVSGLEIRLKNFEHSAAIAAKITEALQGSKQAIYAQDWNASNQPLWEMIKLEKRVYFLVLLLIVIMASFSIVATLVMVVLEKRKDIAVLRTMGASARSIATIFMIQGSSIGAIGTLLGLLLGYLGCLALAAYGFPIDERIFQMSTVPVRIEGMNFVVTGACSFAIACLATLYPALRASSLRPSQVLRYE